MGDIYIYKILVNKITLDYNSKINKIMILKINMYVQVRILIPKILTRSPISMLDCIGLQDHDTNLYHQIEIANYKYWKCQ